MYAEGHLRNGGSSAVRQRTPRQGHRASLDVNHYYFRKIFFALNSFDYFETKLQAKFDEDAKGFGAHFWTK